MHHPPPPHEAVEAPLWHEGDPDPQVRVYPAGHRPDMWIYTRGQWRYAVVQARHTTAGHIAYQCEIHLTEHAWQSKSNVIYQWDPTCMRIISRGGEGIDIKAEYGPKAMAARRRAR